jgi:hypothetical protein
MNTSHGTRVSFGEVLRNSASVAAGSGPPETTAVHIIDWLHVRVGCQEVVI